MVTLKLALVVAISVISLALVPLVVVVVASNVAVVTSLTDVFGSNVKAALKLVSWAMMER